MGIKKKNRKKNESKGCNLNEKYRLLESPIKLTNKMFEHVLKPHHKKKLYFNNLRTIPPDNQSFDKTQGRN